MSSHGFVVRESHPVPLLGAEASLAVHEDAGTRHLHVATADRNATFAVLLATPSADDTGVAHVLEHLVGCGSARYPARRVFFSMLSRSAATFLNGLTGPGWTVYAFSTRVPRDFDHLLAVFLDAVFFPRLEPMAFLQEAWRLEHDVHEDPSTPLRHRGVVLSEMEGEAGIPANVAELAVGRALLAGTPLARAYAGDPAVIPTLDLAATRAFHARRYHPARAWLVTTGAVDPGDVRRALHERVLPSFDSARVPAADPPLTPGPARPVVAPIPSSGGDEDRQTLVGWRTAPVADPEAVLTVELLFEALFRDPSSPVVTALRGMSDGLVAVDQAGLTTWYPWALACVGARGLRASAVDAFEPALLEALNDVRLAPAALERARARLALRLRDLSDDPTPGMPFGVKLLLRLIGPLLYGGDPLDALAAADRHLDTAMRRAADSEHSAADIERWFTGNPGRALVRLEPDAEPAGAPPPSTAAPEDLPVRSALLRAWQDRPDGADLPLLPTAALTWAPDDLAYRDLGVPGLDVIEVRGPLNGTVRVELRLDLAVVPPDDRPLVPLLLALLGGSGEVAWETTVKVRRDGPGGARRETAVLAATRLADGLTAVIHDLARLLTLPLRDVVSRTAAWEAARRGAVPGRAMRYASWLGAAAVTPEGRANDAYQGLSGLAAVAAARAEGPAALTARLEALRAHVLRRAGARVQVVADCELRCELSPALQAVATALPSAATGPSASAPPLSAGTLVWTLPGRVSATALVLPAVTADHPDAAAVMVLAQLLGAAVLHPRVREGLGAYGTGVLHDAELATLSLWSYRDPEPARTLEVFAQAGELLPAVADEARVHAATLAAFTRFDPLVPAGPRVADAVDERRRGPGPEVRSALARRLRTISREDVLAAGERYLTGCGVRVGVAPPAMLAEARRHGALVPDWFDGRGVALATVSA